MQHSKTAVGETTNFFVDRQVSQLIPRRFVSVHCRFNAFNGVTFVSLPIETLAGASKLEFYYINLNCLQYKKNLIWRKSLSMVIIQNDFKHHPGSICDYVYRTTNNVGIIVSEVEQSSPASACGIMAGDRIIEINRIHVENSAFMKILQILKDELKSDEIEFLVTSSVNLIGANYNRASIVRQETPRSSTSKTINSGSSDAMMIASLVGKSTGNYRSHPVILEKSSPHAEWGISVSPDADVGHIISDISPGSPAAKANIRRGHVIIQISDDVVLHLPYKKLISRLQSIITNQVFLSVAPKDVIMKCAIEHIPILTQYDTTKLSQPYNIISKPHRSEHRQSIDERRRSQNIPLSHSSRDSISDDHPQHLFHTQTRQSIDRPKSDLRKPEIPSPYVQADSSSSESTGTPTQKPPASLEHSPDYKLAVHDYKTPELPVTRTKPSQQQDYNVAPSYQSQQPQVGFTQQQPQVGFTQQQPQPSIPVQPASTEQYKQPLVITPSDAFVQEQNKRDSLTPSTSILSTKDTHEDTGPPKSTRIIRIPKSKSTPVGFQLKTFEGGVNSIHAFGDIVKGMAADVAGVQEGDKLISIDGTSVKGLQHEEVLAMLKKDVPVLTVEVIEDDIVKTALESSKSPEPVRQEPVKKFSTASLAPTDSDLLTFTVEVDSNVSSIGLRLTKDMIIQSVETNGPAEKAGLKRGDLVVNVNGENVSSANHQHAFGALRQSISTGQVILTVKRPDDQGIPTKLKDSPRSNNDSLELQSPQVSRHDAEVTRNLSAFVPSLDEPHPSMQDLVRICVLTGLSKNNPIGVSLKDNKTRPAEITKISQGSPASKAGLNIGDYVLKINGTDVENAKFSEIKSMITGSVPTGTLELSVLKSEYYDIHRAKLPHDQQLLKLNIQKKLKDHEVIANPQEYLKDHFGITFEANENNETYVKAIDQNSAGEKSGFTINDIILSINDVSVYKKPINEVLDTLLREARSKEINIKVQQLIIDDETNKIRENSRRVKSVDSIESTKSKRAESDLQNQHIAKSQDRISSVETNEGINKKKYSIGKKMKKSLIKRKLSITGSGKGYKKCIIPTNTISNNIGFTLVGCSKAPGIFYCKNPIPDSCAQLSGMEDGDMIIDVNVKKLKNMNADKLREWIEKLVKYEYFLAFGVIRHDMLNSDQKLAETNWTANPKLLKRASLSSIEQHFDIRMEL
ncbi:hypothetical protein GJ496_003150 [Pomphorhynchus laevis]|nr:hypothetical protein GJ496_003150 [Pomphorhynchus laevis]